MHAFIHTFHLLLLCTTIKSTGFSLPPDPAEAGGINEECQCERQALCRWLSLSKLSAVSVFLVPTQIFYVIPVRASNNISIGGSSGINSSAGGVLTGLSVSEPGAS